MRDFGKVPSDIWDRDELSWNTKALYAYFLSNKHSNYIGCYELKDSYILADTGMTRSAFLRALAQLAEAGLAEREGRTVYLPDFIAENRPRNKDEASARLSVWRDIASESFRAKTAVQMLQFYSVITDDARRELNACISATTGGDTGETVVRAQCEHSVDTSVNTDGDTSADTVPLESREKRVESKEDSLRSSSCAESEPQAAPPVAVSPEKQELLPIASQPKATQVADSSTEAIAAPKPPKPKPKTKPSERNILLDAVVASTGGDIHSTTPAAWSTAATALKQIRTATPEVTPELIAEKARIFRACHDFTLTPSSLAKWWGTLTAEAEAQAQAKLARNPALPPRRAAWA